MEVQFRWCALVGRFLGKIGWNDKKCLKKLIGSERLSFTELSTVLLEIENVLNNRPLCFKYDDNVSEILTPNSLLHGRKLELKINVLMRDILTMLKEMICG